MCVHCGVHTHVCVCVCVCVHCGVHTHVCVRVACVCVCVCMCVCVQCASLVPRLVRGRGKKSLVHTVCACSVFPGFLGIWKLP